MNLFGKPRSLYRFFASLIGSFVATTLLLAAALDVQEIGGRSPSVAAVLI